MPEITLNPDAEEWLYDIDALMAFPKEDRYRQHLSVLNRIDATLQRANDEWIRVRSNLVRQLLTIDSMARVRALAAEQKRQGQRSGHILIALALLSLTKQQASLSKAMYLLRPLYKQFPEVFAGERAVDERHLKSTWAKFEPVAHLWAACETLRLRQLGADAPVRVVFPRRHLSEERARELAAHPEHAVISMTEEQRARIERVEDAGMEPLPWEPREAALVVPIKDVLEMVQLSGWFCDFGANHFSSHQRTKQPTLKREQMWTFSSVKWVFPVEVSAPALPQWAAASLKGYSKRNLPT